MPRAYDIERAFRSIEDELIASMIRNLKKYHLDWELDEGKQWEQWQVLQLQALEKYKKQNRAKFGSKFSDLNSQIEALLRASNGKGQLDQEREILKAIKKGFPAKQVSQGMSATFFRLNDRKLEALIKATKNDMKKAETAVLRMADDKYRQVIFNAQVYANTGAGTYEKAVDMATKDFLAAGINCVQYKNGARHTLADYAEMAIRTASKRAYLQGEGVKRQEWGISTVIVNKRGTMSNGNYGSACPYCIPWLGKVLIDDVWSGGSASGESPQTGQKYPLMSEAVAGGLYHPRCKDIHTTYFEGISTPPKPVTEKDKQAAEENEKKEQKEQYAKRQAKKYERMAEHSLDPENQKKYEARAERWEEKADEFKKISMPINSRHSVGTPPGVAIYGDDLSGKQQKLLGLLQKYDDQIEVNKRTVSMKDLAALTAHEGVEFAVFTKKGKRLIIRGGRNDVNIDADKMKKLARKGYKWSGHTHPVMNLSELVPSPGDREVLKASGKKYSAIYNSTGRKYVFGIDESDDLGLR